ncbi:MAG: ribosome small subunit-dependent GTPase A [Lachnospiraceae bacterium]|nr:ribosome small subunit-dependent GTPase A [Lachnospiraceae bacterium]
MQGKIIKGIAGFYYVHVFGGEIYACKAKGTFRKEKIKPLVGDEVLFEVTDRKDLEGNIMEILPRKSELIRPAVANIDQALLIFAMTRPEPNYNLLDRFLIMMRQQGLECILCFNKSDISDSQQKKQIEEIYGKSGCPILFVSAVKKEGIELLTAVLSAKTTTVAGPSGVGKSSLINCLQQDKKLEIGEISEKIARGKHTTRHSELIAVSDDTYIMDTPGFSSLSLFDLSKEELQQYYPEFEPYRGKCKFMTCAHIHEPVCGVREALEEGHISRVRYDNYVAFYEELKEKEKRKY